MKSAAGFTSRTVDELTIDDERSFRHVGLYADLKEILRRAGYRFRVLSGGSWDDALLLNLTFWGGGEEGGDVLVEDRVPADVIAHAAWHHLAAKAVGTKSASALFLGEAIASAFDLYLVGRLVGHAPDSEFLATQVPAMSDAAAGAGLDERAFESLVEGVTDDPERAFAELRELLTDATSALFSARSVADAAPALAKLHAHRYGPLLHRYELSNWVLYARAYGETSGGEGAHEVDRQLREANDPLGWLTK
ncbi:MAG: hypothetical protein ACXVEE_18775, partial [Polyangiales bacterium]